MVNLPSDEKREDTKKQREKNGKKFSCVVNVAEKRDETDRSNYISRQILARFGK